MKSSARCHCFLLYSFLSLLLWSRERHKEVMGANAARPGRAPFSVLMSSNPSEVFGPKVFGNLPYQQNCYLFGWDRLSSVKMWEQSRGMWEQSRGRGRSKGG